MCVYVCMYVCMEASEVNSTGEDLLAPWVYD